MKIKLLLIGLLLPLIIFYSCSNKRRLRTNVENPIILVSGYGSKASVWENTGFVDFLKQQGFVYGGKLMVDKNNFNKIITEKTITGNIDFFSLAYSDSTSKVSELSIELKKAIRYVKRYTNAKKVMLLGYSMGGIVCRDYLVKNIKRHNVETLITIDSPHKGSFLANIATATSNLLKDKVIGVYLDMISSQLDIDIDGDALDDLLIEEDDNYLGKLNNSPHPSDINYVSIIGINEMAIKINPYLQRKLGLSFYDGDLVCSRESQNMQNISWFITNKPKLLMAYKIKGVNHLNVLTHHEIIFTYISKFIRTNSVSEIR